MLPEPIIKRLTLARYLFLLAADTAKGNRDVATSACINILHDALEIFLLTGTDFTNANVGKNADFIQLLDRVNEKIGDELPFRRRLIQINKVRVLSKHEGISPNWTELQGYLDDARLFFEQACSKIFDAEFWTLSLVDILDGEIKDHLKEAEHAFKIGNFSDCLVACRKAIYVQYEEKYSIEYFETHEDDGVISFFRSSAPAHARSKKYIEQSVSDPFDYIVRDHGRIDDELTKEGLPHGAFWNIWRLTPEVFRHSASKEWLVKKDFEKLDETGIRDRASYILDATVGLFVQKHFYHQSLRWIRGSVRYVIEEVRPNTKIYRKADVNSPVVGEISGKLNEAIAEFSTQGLYDDRNYWKIRRGPSGGYLSGYILEDDIVF